MKICILNFATKTNKVYMRGQTRLVQSLKKTGFKGDVYSWKSESQFGCPTHREVPYAFKPYALKWARDKGYDCALWLDASFWAIKPLDPIFGIIKDTGHLMQNDGNRLGHWTHDRCLNKYGITRDEAMKIRMYSAGCTGLNFSNEKSNDFLDQWYDAANDGESFQGDWDNKRNKMSKDPRCRGHRHDMSVATILAHKLEMDYQKAWSIFTYGKNSRHPDVYLICRGY